MNTSTAANICVKIVIGAKYQVGDRVHYTYRAFYKNLFGTVVDVIKSEYGKYLCRVKFDTFQGSSLEGMWLEESHLEPETALEALAFCLEAP